MPRPILRSRHFHLMLALTALPLATSVGCQESDDPLAGAVREAALGPEDPADLSGQVPDFEGEFVTRVADDFEGKRSEIMHMLVAEGRSVRLDVSPEDYPDILQRGAVVQAFGSLRDDGTFEVDRLVQKTPPPQMSIDPEVRPARRVAWIQVYWTGKNGIGKEDAKNRIFTGEDSVNAFYQENSFGKDKIAGDVFGWFEIPNPNGSADLISMYARKALADSGIPEWRYTQFMYYFPTVSGLGWAGLANLGDPEFPARDSWYNGSAGCVVLNQEIGHNYGLVHSNSVSCVDENDQYAIFSDNCEDNEYGDPYEPMGSGCGHMNIFQKGAMGWLDGCNTVTATSDATFNLLPMEIPCDGIQSLRIPIGNKYYYLEYRQPVGEFDKGLSGVLVHVARNYGSTNPWILDMYDGPGAFMRAGDSYTDHQGRVTFTVVEENPTHAVIELTFPGGGDGQGPECFDVGGAPEQSGGNYGVLDCAAGPLPYDDTPPTVTITYPEDGQVFEPGTSFDILAEAMDERGVTDVELYIDGEPVYMDIEAPWSWPVVNIPEGEYSFGVVARDGPNWAASNVVNIKVQPMEAGSGSAGSTGAGTDGGTSGTAGDTDTDGSGATTSDSGCGCRAQGPSGPAAGLWILVLAGAHRLRRRRSQA